jgi:hypothetical protein
LLSKHWPKEPYLSNFKWKRAWLYLIYEYICAASEDSLQK